MLNEAMSFEDAKAQFRKAARDALQAAVQLFYGDYDVGLAGADSIMRGILTGEVLALAGEESPIVAAIAVRELQGAFSYGETHGASGYCNAVWGDADGTDAGRQAAHDAWAKAEAEFEAAELARWAR